MYRAEGNDRLSHLIDSTLGRGFIGMAYEKIQTEQALAKAISFLHVGQCLGGSGDETVVVGWTG